MTILDEAAELINGQRAKDYGDVTENFARIAQLWSAYKGEPFSPHDVAMMMILVKVARQSSGYHHDSIVDIAGYAALDEKVYIGLQVQDIKQQIEAVKEQMRKPRMWQSLVDVPRDVRVTSAGGHIWTYWTVDSWYDEYGVRDKVDPGWLYTQVGATISNRSAYRDAPFTEVLDTEQKGSK